MGMRRRIKPSVLYTTIVIILVTSILIVFNNIFKLISAKDISKSDIKIDMDMIPVTELIMNSCNVSSKGPKPKPEKIAYITIDDGPSKYTNEILHILKRNDVKATFFMIDKNMRNHSMQVKRIVDEGHSAGFHSVSHDINLLYNSPEATVNEFDKCKATFNELTSSISNLIRLPYGSKPYAPKESYEALVNNGYKVWDWNLDTQDWRATTDEIINNVELYFNQHRELVLLMHEKEQTVKALQKIIDILKDNGYTIAPIEEDDYPKNYWEQNLIN